MKIGNLIIFIHITILYLISNFVNFMWCVHLKFTIFVDLTWSQIFCDAKIGKFPIFDDRIWFEILCNVNFGKFINFHSHYDKFYAFWWSFHFICKIESKVTTYQSYVFQFFCMFLFSKTALDADQKQIFEHNIEKYCTLLIVTMLCWRFIIFITDTFSVINFQSHEIYTKKQKEAW